MFARVKRWGNSLTIRLSKKELERYGIKEGDHVRVTLHRATKDAKMDLSGLPMFTDPDARASERHDELLYGR